MPRVDRSRWRGAEACAARERERGNSGTYIFYSAFLPLKYADHHKKKDEKRKNEIPLHGAPEDKGSVVGLKNKDKKPFDSGSAFDT